MATILHYLSTLQCKNQLTHTISKYDYELTPNDNKQDVSK